ncbi:Sec20 family protein [Gossypium australe]|uniref:Sec20 family protein n=1 Tax=Gossypium australe TaxID=47621 RepID=A0A5B6WTW4_9ROSI|nr:Sec20 family protein [Gossypium australe]
MDKVVEEVEKTKKEWDEAYSKTQQHIKEIQEYGNSTMEETKNKNSLPRLNGLAQDGLALLNSLQFNLDLLAPQLPTDDEVQSAKALLKTWRSQSQSLRMNLRNANLQAKDNMRKTAQKERELLLGGGEESTVRRRNLQTKAGMTSAAESITESLRRTRQLMVQEVERSTNTLMTFEESTGVLKKAESEYKGHRSLLSRTRNLLSTMQRHDVIDRIVLVVGFILFSCAVLYVVSKRIGILKLQRTITAAIKAGMAGKPELARKAVEEGINQGRFDGNVVPDKGLPLQQPMRDEL